MSSVFVSFNTKLAQNVLNESYNFAERAEIPAFGKPAITAVCMTKIEHIGIAVRSLEDAVPRYEKLLNTPCYKTETVENEKVNTAFFQTGPNKIELLESADPEGVIARFIDKKGEGLHHIAFEVADIYSEMERLKKEGFVLLNPEPKNGADNKLICFLHPKHCNGVLIELCMSKEVTVEDKSASGA